MKNYLDIYVIAAGSLLENLIDVRVSFPVGSGCNIWHCVLVHFASFWVLLEKNLYYPF